MSFFKTKVSNSRRIGGLRAKAVGDSWETLFKNSAERQGCHALRIPNGCRWVSSTRVVPVRSPFDWVLLRRGLAIFVDTKTTLSPTWTHSMNDPGQLKSLKRCHDQNHRAGYVVEFRKLNTVVFYDVVQLLSLKPRTSLRPEDGVLISSDVKQLNFEVLFNE